MIATAPSQSRFPVPVVEEAHGILVVRDDLLVGGTKRRALHAIVDSHVGEHVYASPAYGYAQVALAHHCADIGHKATIFTAKRRHMHPRTLEAKRAGAKIVMVPYGYLSNTQAKARAYAALTGAQVIPFGMDDPAYIYALAQEAKRVADTVGPMREVWSVAGSGTLTRALQQAWPYAAFHAVQIGHVLTQDKAGRAKIWVASERFEDDAKAPPPFPSCSNYDAKAWRFIRAHARPGALFWNVAA